MQSPSPRFIPLSVGRAEPIRRPLARGCLGGGAHFGCAGVLAPLAAGFVTGGALRLRGLFGGGKLPGVPARSRAISAYSSCWFFSTCCCRSRARSIASSATGAEVSMAASRAPRGLHARADIGGLRAGGNR